MNLTNIKLVSWDVDGTLYPIRSLYFQLARQFLIETAHGRYRSAQRELSEIGRFRKEFSKKSGLVCQEVFADLNRAQVRSLERKWFGIALKNIEPLRPVAQALDFVKHHGIPQVVLSNFEADYKISALGLNSYFEKLWSCENMQELKPSAFPFKALQEHHRVRPEQHLHIGDRDDTDGEGARRSGCHYLNVKLIGDHGRN